MNNQGYGLASPTMGFLTFGLALAGPILAMTPLGIAPLFMATAILATLAERIVNRRWPHPPRFAIIFLSLFIIFCAISLIWDINLKDGARKLLDIAAIAVSALVLTGLSVGMNVAQRRRLAIALIGGICVGLILLGIETVFDFPLYRAVMGGSDPKLTDLIESKRAVDALPLLVWPACLALAAIELVWLGVFLAVFFTVMCFMLTASSATLGMVLSLIVFGVAWAATKGMRRLLQAGTLAAFALVIPFSIWAYDNGAATSSLLKRSAQHRMEIWHFAALRSLDWPLFGHGINASRDIPNGGAVSMFLGPDKPIIPLHPHNGFLQIWLELGLTGVTIVAGLLLFLLNATRKWPVKTQPFALATYGAGIIIAGLAFGLWQTWWMATLAFSVVACAIIAPEANHG
jgi:O-antigen ligase